ncbi:hypothetical protein BO78DRAFT_424672 [Aspergillus sclerotiicarbonarius CBS 121057]|uniref:Protein kinase domain-containing protein n=1 Tax=Aspergillus sclerotiicarbonarius (strain CBS 121057 / IBT 28362) TaxID=1448318 RepID=A0A319EHG8_ASPSB|nr:hypothetical protein BO78DRAFT_424672 [Aspergillus sclerotiicarbonarius CBS 121057]
MEIIRSFKTIKRVDRQFQLDYICCIVKQDGTYYNGRWHDVNKPPQALFELSHIQKMNETLRDDPRYNEVKVYEYFQEYPHPNLGIYFGCHEQGGFITSTCCGRYGLTLAQRVNPKNLSKEEFRASDRKYVDDLMKDGLKGVLAGIRHLHRNGMMHNNINPSTIQLTWHETPVIVGFGCTRSVGASLRNFKRAPHWHDPKVQVSMQDNDLEAYEELKTWMIGSVEDRFRFE